MRNTMQRVYRRSEERVSIAQEVLINRLIPGIALDISSDGMFINVPSHLRKGTLVTLSFRIKGRPIEIKAIVRHVSEMSIGVQFRDMTESQADLIEEFIEENEERRRETAQRGGRPVVLMADDAPLSTAPFKRQLILAGYRVIQVANGIEAVKVLKDSVETGSEAKIDLVITDLRMPGMDGLKVVKVMQGDSKLKDIPVVMLSAAHRGDQDIMEAHNVSIVRFFMKHNTKPIDFAREIAKILELRKKQEFRRS